MIYDTASNSKNNCNNAFIHTLIVEKSVALLAKDRNANIIDYGFSPYSEKEFYDVFFVVNSKDGARRFTVEIKNDIASMRTGNIGIEYECRGKPSGIAITKADYWMHIIRHDGKFLFLVIKPNLLNVLIEKKAKAKKIGGDNFSNTKMHLIAIKDILPDGNKNDNYYKMKEWMTINNFNNNESLIQTIHGDQLLSAKINISELFDWAQKESKRKFSSR